MLKYRKTYASALIDNFNISIRNFVKSLKFPYPFLPQMALFLPPMKFEINAAASIPRGKTGYSPNIAGHSKLINLQFVISGFFVQGQVQAILFLIRRHPQTHRRIQ